MKLLSTLTICIVGLALFSCSPKTDTPPPIPPLTADVFPDGTEIPDWFSDTTKITLAELGTQFIITDYGVKEDSTVLQTEAIQQTIDNAAEQGGGVVIIPKGVYLSGALFFKPKTSLYLAEGAVLKGSDKIEDYPKIPSRMEGQNLAYFPALINAYGVDGFSISGKGTLNGNGMNYWKAFWQRREENPDCTNLEVSRPRLVFIWDCDNVQLQDVKLINAGFWSSHYYQCNNVKILDLFIYSPYQPIKAPSTDAIDLDVCSNVLIKDCYMSVNDDAIALKGGKGPLADKDSLNGENTNIIIENCEFGFCHSALTCGSESIHNKNIIMRDCFVTEAKRLLWLKMRDDTPQKYEYITVKNIKGQVHSCIYVKPWSQFFDLKGQTERPISTGEHVTMSNLDLKCDIFFDVKTNEFNQLSHFVFEDMVIETKNPEVDKSIIEDFTLKNVMVNNSLVQ
ncbi:glycosyl hydrolase family 28 protein [Flammeovirgaceae bacterium SG7u.111]|nr:glycosyl hydrolase family 28 protein [Flammeovirgaceae bacterium SG7u.132]WPO33130.1 glycosyl hydrolase family 28 protein [Flammeovirgaceae bacterium SG7u.111]